jgi:hypothetical protein
LILSFLAHFVLGVTLFFTALPNRYSASGLSRLEENVIGRLVKDFYRNVSLKEPPISEVTPEQVSAVLKKLYDRLEFARDLTETERAEILEKILDTKYEAEAVSILHPLSEAEMDDHIDERVRKTDLQLSSRDPIEISKQGSSGKYTVHKINAKTAALIDRMKEETSTGSVMTISGGQTVLVPTGNGPKEVPAEYYFRTSPYRKMAAVRGGLFTIVREHANPLDFTREPRLPEGITGNERTAEHLPGGESPIIVFISTQSAGTAVASAERRPLKLSKSQFGEILDDLMALDVEEQLTIFKREYLDRYDWESADLALLTREFIFNNMNGVFFVLDDLAGAFDQAEELFYKRPVYDFFAGMAGCFPRTRTDSEIRFYLASAQDFELRTLRKILVVRSDIDAVIKGKRRPASMFQPEAKAFVLGQICDDLLQSVGKLRISPGMVIDWYMHRQQEILSELTECGGETQNRALVTWGKLLWREGEYDRAIAMWKKADMSIPSYSRAFEEIIRIIDRYGFNGKVQRAIDEILYTEDVPGREDRLNRHLKFHTWDKRSGR